MNNPYYLGVVATALASAISQILLNVSARKTYPSRLREYLNPYVISSYGILAVSLVVNIYLLRFMELKAQNVIASLTYVFVLLLSRVILGEKLGWKKILGNVFIVVGILVFVQTT